LKRVLTGLVGAPIVIAALFWDRPWGIVALCLVFFMVCSWEYLTMLKAAGHKPMRAEGMTLTLAFLVASYWKQFDGLDVLIAAGAIGLLLGAFIRGMPVAKIMVSTAGTLFGAIYAGYLGGFVIRLKMQGDTPEGQHWGTDLLLLLILMTWANDIFAYIVGKRFGRHALAPVASPKKTWEGAVGGLLGSLGVAFLLQQFAIKSLETRDVIIVTVIIVVLGIMGDLCESLLKRSAGVKDSGNILPGHGGALDRLDSMIFAAPALYYYYHFFLDPTRWG
jgi:phosphatidate cytidylyltransferase